MRVYTRMHEAYLIAQSERSGDAAGQIRTDGRAVRAIAIREHGAVLYIVVSVAWLLVHGVVRLWQAPQVVIAVVMNTAWQR